MTDDLVERVARAICTANGVDPDIEHADKFGEILVNWMNFEPQARAAIAAMREPTEAMIKAGTAHGGQTNTDVIWQAMIDAALSPGERE
jgi:hypothetical protein